MKRVAYFVCAALFAAPTAQAANPCEDLWFTRTAILAQGGYCLTSPLGQNLFESANCSDDEPLFPDFLQAQMDRIAELEAESTCNIDDNAEAINIWQLETRKGLLIQPIMHGKDRLCIMKAPTSLRAAPSPDADQLGWLERGDIVQMRHDEAGGADFASRVRRGVIIIDDIGWFSSSQCKAL